MKKYVYETDFNDDDDGDIGGLGLAFLSFSICSSKIFAPVFVCLEIDEELSRRSLGPTSKNHVHDMCNKKYVILFVLFRLAYSPIPCVWYDGTVN